MAETTDGDLRGGQTTPPYFLRHPTLSLPQSGDEIRVLRFLDALESEATSAKEFSSRHWEESFRQLRGDQWRLKRAPHFMANLVRNQVERKVAALTEVKPSIKVVPLKSQHEKASEILRYTIRSIMDSQHFDQELYRMAYFAMTIGPGFLTTYYDPSAGHYKGDIQLRMVDPRRILLDPGVTEAEQLDRAAYLIVESFDTLNNIRLRFPGRGALVKADQKYSSMMESRKQSTAKAGILSAVLQSFPRVFKPGPAIKEGPIKRANLKEYWIADPQLGDDGQPLFPTGRHVIRSGDVILVDEPNPYWDGKWPIDMMDWNLDFDAPWGTGEVHEMRRIQEAFNRIGDGIIRNALISNNVKVIADMDALDQDKWDQLTNEGGIIIRKRPGRDLSYEMPKEMPQYLFQLMTQLLTFLDLLTGNVDVTAGKRPSGVMAASAIEGLQMQAQTLVRSIARRLEGLLERVGQKLIARVFQFYTADRVLQLLGPSGDWISYTFERQKLLQTDTGTMVAPLDRATKFRDFRFLVVPGSSLASTRVQRTMMLLQLRQALGGFTPPIEAILKEADLGDPETMIKEGLEELQKYGITPTPPKPTRKK